MRCGPKIALVQKCARLFSLYTESTYGLTLIGWDPSVYTRATCTKGRELLVSILDKVVEI